MHQRSGDGGQDPSVAGLAAQVDRIRLEVAALATAGAVVRTDVESHTRTLTDLSDLLRRVTTADSGTADDDEPETRPEWMTVTDPGAAVNWLTGLSIWVRDVYAQYAPIPGCWPWHPPAVAELLACHAPWAAAVAAEAAPDTIANWHDRWRPGTQHRLDDMLAGCQRARGLHVEGAARYDYDPAYLDEYAAHWAGSHDPAGNAAPGLTPNREDRR